MTADKAGELLERLTTVMEALVQHEEESEAEQADEYVRKERRKMKKEYAAGVKSKTADMEHAKVITGPSPDVRRRILEISLFPNIFNKAYIG